MRKGVLFSGLLHLAIVVIAVFGLPSLLEPVEVQQPIPVQVVDIAEVTTPPKQEKKPEAKPETPPRKQPPKQPEPKPQEQAQLTPPPAPPAPKAEPEPEPEAEPAPPEPVVAPPPPEPAPEPEPVPEPEPEPVKAEPLPVPMTKPEPPKRQVAEKKSDEEKEKKPAEPKPAKETPAKEERPVTDFASVLKNVEKLKQEGADETSPDPEPAPEAVAQERNLSDRPLTLSEKDAIRAQIERCWNVPVGARDAENLVVEIRVMLNPDGSVVATPEILNNARMASDPFFRAAAESARRAVLKCSPLRMPDKAYSLWKVMTLTFNPKDMF